MSRTQPVAMLLAISACLSLCSVANAAPSSLTSSPSIVPDGLTVVYDPLTGGLATHAPDGKPLSAFELRSAGELFLGTCENTDGPFDVCRPEKIFTLDTKGFQEIDYGPALPSNLTSGLLLGDITVDGASVGGDFDYGTGTYLYVVPEPMASGLMVLGLLILGTARRRS